MTPPDISRLLGSDADQQRNAAWWNDGKAPKPTTDQLARTAAVDEETAWLETAAVIQKAKA